MEKTTHDSKRGLELTLYFSLLVYHEAGAESLSTPASASKAMLTEANDRAALLPDSL